MIYFLQQSNAQCLRNDRKNGGVIYNEKEFCNDADSAALTTTSVCGFAFADEAANDPYGKYDELVTYTTGYSLTNQGADVLAGTPYENDTPENNAYTRYLKELLNIQNENDFEATMGDDYNHVSWLLQLQARVCRISFMFQIIQHW